jgi:hypothetical protein
MKSFKILPKLLGMGFEDRTEPLKIGVVEEENEYLSRLGKVGDEVTVSLWREVCGVVIDRNLNLNQNRNTEIPKP